MRILIAEDDATIAAGLRSALVEDGYVVDQVADGSGADRALRDKVYDVLVLDLGLPRLDGMDVVKQARSRGDTTAILVVTARGDVMDRIRVLDLGADDYLVKPFSLMEFAARIRALVRRHANRGIPEITLGQLRMDIAGRRACIDQAPIELTGRESALLEALMTRQDRLVSRAQLTEALCNWEQELTDNGLDIAVHRLRRKLEGSHTRIRTIRGLGYILEEDANNKQDA